MGAPVPVGISVLSDYRARPLGSSFISASGVATGGSSTLIAPVSNTNGIVLRTAMLYTLGLGIISSGTTSPSGPSDTTHPAIAYANSGMWVMPREILLPAGYGLWCAFSDVNNRVAITFEVF